MRKLLIFGNSGSGKSTLASKLRETEGLAHLDLDTLAWRPSTPPIRQPITHSEKAINKFVQTNDRWVIEGCYTDLLELALPAANEIIFLNLPVEVCVQNAMNRPWEPHKYESQTAQDANLNMLLDWIRQYTAREDTFSYSAHHKLYQTYTGSKSMRTKNDPITRGI